MGRSDQPAPNPEGEPQSVGDRATLGRASDVLGRIDRYELIQELGGGGFGVVFLARDTIAGIEVAVKGLPPLIQANKEELERVRENFALVSRLHHPHIAAPLVLHQARDVWYASESIRQKMRVLPEDFLFVMAYAPGVTLSKWRKQFPGGRVPPEQALAVCQQIADALDYAHGERIIHRDIKPSNVMIETRADGRTLAHLLDFGLAAEIRSSMGRISRDTGDTSGTRPYMAPEQWLGKKQGPATDQYAMAVMFHELVTGSVPFGPAFETGDPVIMANVATKEMPDPVAELDKKANAVLQRALSKNPAERYASCRAFVDALGGGHSSATAGKGEAGRAVPRAPLAIGIGLAIALGLAFWFWGRNQEMVTQSVPAVQSPAARQDGVDVSDRIPEQSPMLNQSTEKLQVSTPPVQEPVEKGSLGEVTINSADQFCIRLRGVRASLGKRKLAQMATDELMRWMKEKGYQTSDADRLFHRINDVKLQFENTQGDGDDSIGTATFIIGRDKYEY